MEPIGQLKEYLRNSREKRKSLINIANDYYNEILKEESQKPSFRSKSREKENDSKLPPLPIIYEKRGSSDLKAKSSSKTRLHTTSSSRVNHDVLRQRYL
ncbi:unnamed protein product [Blepharisma stoltei]|uniref:Uncharacterized protein n=1 Tax=Blepharisma stoltei TaxID=1481888 RepID=A0AAU9JNP6_9CILI|nr:unnamed protein product [Blepharisma stoltei]